MKEIPILFSTPMVQALLAGTKTQTRRIIKSNINYPHPGASGQRILADWHLSALKQLADEFVEFEIQSEVDDYYNQKIKCPYGKTGDLLWVREAFGELYDTEDHSEIPGGYTERWSLGFKFRADNYEHEPQDGFWTGWRPSIHMPKEVARIWLEKTGTRVERIKNISQADCIAEGIEKDELGFWKNYLTEFFPFGNPFDSYKSLWKKINGPESWDENPWAWVNEFKIISIDGKPQ